MATIAIQYCFRLSDERQEVFDLELDAERLELVGGVPENLPQWTKLDFCQCPNCTLDIGTHPHCPAASHLADVVRRFGDILSYDQVCVDVLTQERRISQDTTAQTGIGSFMGLVMATSGCPHLAFFKPMARFHLPLANDEETVYRSVSMYLLGQYFVGKAGGNPDFELDGLKNIYNDVKLINSCIVERLRTATQKDSSLNAVIALDSFAEVVLFVIEESLEEIRHLFTPHLEIQKAGE